MGCGPRGQCLGDRQSTRRRPGDQGQPGDPALFHQPKQVTAMPELRGRTSVSSRAALAQGSPFLGEGLLLGTQATGSVSISRDRGLGDAQGVAWFLPGAA